MLNFFREVDRTTTYEIEQRKRTFNVVLLVVFIGSIPLGILNFIFGFFLAGITVLVLSAACLLALGLNQKGYYTSAAALISFLLIFVIIFDIADAGGIGNDLGMMALPVVILVCSLFFGKQGLAIFSVICMIAVAILGVLDIQKVIYAPPLKTDFGDLFTALILLACTAILLWTILDNAEHNLQKIKSDDARVWVSYGLTLEGLVKTLELRDQETEQHSRRVVDLSLKLANALSLSSEDQLIISRGALLHDIGKLGVPDYVLLKPGPLNEEEWVEMRKHPEYAQTILANIPFLQPCITIPHYHHERWDGTGYPCGLKGEEIPYFARLFSIVDQWEAITSDRVYRKAWPKEKALTYIRDNSGILYDPEIAAVFLNSIEQFEATPELYKMPPKEEVGNPSLDGSPTSPVKSDSDRDTDRTNKRWGKPDLDISFDPTQYKRTLKLILWVVFFGSQAVGWIDLFSLGPSLIVWVVFSISGLCLLNLYLNSKGHYTIGAFLICLLLLVATGVGLLTWRGLHDTGVVTFPLIVAIGSLFFGKRGLIIFTLLAGIVIGAIGLLEINQQVSPIFLPTDIWDVIILQIYILGISVIMWSILDHFEKTRLRIKKKEAELRQSYDLTLEGFARALEFRGREPAGHSQRVVMWSLRLAEDIGLKGSELENVRRGALLHDIGSLFIPDQIFLKPGPLNEEEWGIMRKHPERARDLLSGIPFLQSCIAIPYSHHENWDGTGYPQGLKGEDIPLAARLFALVDQWEELSNDRPYRPAWSSKAALNYLRENSGRLYDPFLTTRFLGLLGSPDSL